MADSAMTGSDSKDKRGLASADASTRRRVAQMGGAAYHEKRGAKGKDIRPTDS